MAEKEGKIKVEIVTPVKLLFSESTNMVVIPGGEGDFGVLVGHAPMISQVRAGTINIYNGDKVSTQIFVEGGIAEVTSEGCIVLAEEAVRVVDIDKKVALQLKPHLSLYKEIVKENMGYNPSQNTKLLNELRKLEKDIQRLEERT